MDDTKLSETADDIANEEAWARVIADVLWLAPAEGHARILELATQYTAKADAERGKLIWAGDFLKDYEKSPAFRNWNPVMRLKSLLVQVFTRTICNNHDAVTARRLLFCEHRYGTGSRCLSDYVYSILQADLFDGPDNTETP